MTGSSRARAPRLVLFTRFPEPGRAKTRLIPALGAVGAARLHRRLTERTLETMRASALSIEIRTTGAAPAAFRAWLGAAAAIVDQGEGDLGMRLARAAEAPPLILLGADAPGLTVAHLEAASTALDRGRFAIGPAEDGGYWLLGLPRRAPFLFADMPWSTDRLLACTIEALGRRGIAPVLLPRLDDLDRPEDLARFPEFGAG